MWSVDPAGKKLRIGVALGETIRLQSGSNSETNFETYVRHQINQWSYISAHYQYQKNPAFPKWKGNYLGCRVNFNF